MSKLMVGVVEKFDATSGDDLMLRSAVQYALRGLLVGEDGPRADWTPEEVRDRVLSESCGLVVVILDGEALDQIGPKCYAAIEAAQQSARPLIVLAPVLRASALCGLSKIELFCDGREPLTVAHDCVTPRIDAVVLTILRLCEDVEVGSAI